MAVTRCLYWIQFDSVAAEDVVTNTGFYTKVEINAILLELISLNEHVPHRKTKFLYFKGLISVPDIC